MKKFIGDLSKEDAALLENYAAKSHSVLEFGVGGSTQIIAQSIPDGASFISLDTSDEWIAKTEANLRRLGTKNRCQITRYENWPSGIFDMIFDDGEPSLRREFALRSFPMLKVGGVILFHDTRTLSCIQNALAIVETFFEEVEQVSLNERIAGVSSNITVIRKKAKEPYVNWNDAEGRPQWQIGYGDVPEDFWTS